MTIETVNWILVLLCVLYGLWVPLKLCGFWDAVIREFSGSDRTLKVAAVNAAIHELFIPLIEEANEKRLTRRL